jgi:hypothetical protein
MLQTDRRHDPYPFTWELPLGIGATWLSLAVLGIHLGRALANLFAGSGWAWPTGRALFTSLAGVVTGSPTAGLATPLTTPASTMAVVSWIIAVEVVLFAGIAVAGWFLLRRWGPARLRGMATPAEAEATLGLSRLRRVRHLIRPDLHHTHWRQP